MRKGRFDGSSLFDACNASLPKAMYSADLISSPTLSSILPTAAIHPPTVHYEPYSYLSKESDAPPKVEPCNAFLDARLRRDDSFSGATIPNKVHFIYGLGTPKVRSHAAPTPLFCLRGHPAPQLPTLSGGLD